MTALDAEVPLSRKLQLSGEAYTGLAIGGAPVVIPFVAMAAAGVAISKGFDRIFGE